MARIRTIKPELPQSESLGRVSRDARLLFVELWCICDDEGRTRGASRLLASLLFPYDSDAPELIDSWIGELEAIGAVRRYAVDGSTYIDIPNWLKHQKIDHPTKSKIPASPSTARPRPHQRSYMHSGERIVSGGGAKSGSCCVIPVPRSPRAAIAPGGCNGD